MRILTDNNIKTLTITRVLLFTIIMATANIATAFQATPGSFLVIPVFDISGSNTTELQITNMHPSSSIGVVLNMVCPGTREDQFCDALDLVIPIGASTTETVDVGNLNPPCQQGFIVVFAVNNNNKAIAWDHLLGTYKMNNDAAADAISIHSVKPEGTVLGADDALQFGPDSGPDQDYAALGTKLSTDYRSINGTSGSELVLLTLDAVAGGHNPVTRVGIKFGNTATTLRYSTSFQNVCWTRVRLDRIDFNFLTANSGSATGFMEITPEPNCPIPGGCPPLFKFDPVVLGAIIKVDGGTTTTQSLVPVGGVRSTTYIPR